MIQSNRKCLYCQKSFFGRSDKKYCDKHCKSAHEYKHRKEKEPLFYLIDRQLKTNRSILKLHNRSGKTIVRKSHLIRKGFNPNYFTNYWKSNQGEVYLFCYEFGFLEIKNKDKPKYVLVQWQDYMYPK